MKDQGPTFDRNGYPTRRTMTRLRRLADPTAALTFLADAWQADRGSLLIAQRPPELALFHADDGAVFLRVETGGWSGNEALITAFQRNGAWRLTWQLSARGGLHMFKYPRGGGVA